MLFIGTLLPYHAFHSHPAEEHLQAQHSLKQQGTHHCELEHLACQGDYKNDCEHKTHLSGPEEKCFSCQFDFVKCYEELSFHFTFVFNAHPNVFNLIVDVVYCSFPVQLSGRGPPIC